MDYSPLWILNFISKNASWCNHPFSTPCTAEGSLHSLAETASGKRFSATHLLPEAPHMQRQLSRREERSIVFLCTTSLTRGGSLERMEQGKLGPVQKRTQDLRSKTHLVAADRRADPWQPLEGCPQLLHCHSLTEAFMVDLAMNTGNSSAPSQQRQPPPVTIPLHDERLSNPTTTNLCVGSPCSTRDSAASLLPWACGRGRHSSLTFLPLPSRQHL